MWVEDDAIMSQKLPSQSRMRISTDNDFIRLATHSFPHTEWQLYSNPMAVFSAVNRMWGFGNGISQQEARLPLNFPQFSASDFGKYSCITSITSESLPGARTNAF